MGILNRPHSAISRQAALPVRPVALPWPPADGTQIGVWARNRLEEGDTAESFAGEKFQRGYLSTFMVPGRGVNDVLI